jgi:hypothetical protein
MYNFNRFRKQNKKNTFFSLCVIAISVLFPIICITLAFSVFIISIALSILLFIFICIFVLFLLSKYLSLEAFMIYNMQSSDPKSIYLKVKNDSFGDNKTDCIIGLAYYLLKTSSSTLSLKSYGINCDEPSAFDQYSLFLSASLVCILNEDKYKMLLERYLFQISKLLANSSNTNVDYIAEGIFTKYNLFIEKEYDNIKLFLSNNEEDRINFSQIINDRFFYNTPNSSYIILEKMDENLFKNLDSSYKSIMIE